MTQLAKIVLFFFFFTCLLNPLSLRCEFYEYIDENGVKNYTDDKSLIPENQRLDTRVHKEKYDHLEEEERKERIEKEKRQIEVLNQKTRAKLDQMEKQEEIEKQNQLKIERQKRLESLKTPVKIIRNQILVPVSIKYSGKEITTTLLLDTGASITTIHLSVADQLNIRSAEQSVAVVAGGGIVKTWKTEVEKIKVGPKSKAGHTIMIFKNTGFPTEHHGLLGQDFLQNFNYTINYEKSQIVWEE